MNKLYALLIVLCCCLWNHSHAQRFNAGFLVGMNLSQLDGDNELGYNKIGLQIGARGSAIITKRFEVSTGLLYTQKGSSFKNSLIREKIKLNYMEVPILINFKSKYVKPEKFYRWQSFTGISIGRLINSSIEEDTRDDYDFTAVSDFLNSSDLSYILGINYYFDRHFAVGVQSSISFNRAYDASENPVEGNLVSGLRNYLLNFRFLYMLW